MEKDKNLENEAIETEKETVEDNEPIVDDEVQIVDPAEDTPETSENPEAEEDEKKEESAETEEEAESEEEPAPVEEEEEEVPAEESPEEENEDKSVEFSLVDFQNLQESYSNLEAKFNDLQKEFDVLVEFKNSKDREEKQAMIDSFYMLSDSDKEDVQKNIDTYTLDEIEAKLSIICVHNKLDLSGKTDNENNLETTFSLDNVDNDSEDTNIPALVSALRKNKKSEK